MEDPERKTLNSEEKEILRWISTDYLRSLYTLIDSNRVYLNQGFTWSIGIISAVLIFSISYVFPLQEVRSPESSPGARSVSALLENISEADVVLLTVILSVSFAFVSNFLSRSIKGYVNLIRYVALYSSCLRLASGKVDQSPSELRKMVEDINTYDAELHPPLFMYEALWKMLKELGYGLTFLILIGLHIVVALVWLSFPDPIWKIGFWTAFCLGPVWLIIELVALQRSRYFRYDKPAVSWPEAQRLK